MRMMACTIGAPSAAAAAVDHGHLMRARAAN
jgi:hypothetical protein